MSIFQQLPRKAAMITFRFLRGSSQGATPVRKRSRNYGGYLICLPEGNLSGHSVPPKSFPLSLHGVHPTPIAWLRCMTASILFSRAIRDTSLSPFVTPWHDLSPGKATSFIISTKTTIVLTDQQSSQPLSPSGHPLTNPRVSKHTRGSALSTLLSSADRIDQAF